MACKTMNDRLTCRNFNEGKIFQPMSACADSAGRHGLKGFANALNPLYVEFFEDNATMSSLHHLLKIM